MARRRGLPISGWINLDKPAGMTSTTAVGRVRYLLNAAKAGHAGTLDPLQRAFCQLHLAKPPRPSPMP